MGRSENIGGPLGWQLTLWENLKKGVNWRPLAQYCPYMRRPSSRSFMEFEEYLEVAQATLSLNGLLHWWRHQMRPYMEKSTSNFSRQMFAWFLGLLRRSFHILNFQIYPANYLEVRAHLISCSPPLAQCLKLEHSILLNFQTLHRKNLKIGDVKAMPQKTHKPCEHLSRKIGTTSFPHMVSSDDVTNGEAHSKL